MQEAFFSHEVTSSIYGVLADLTYRDKAFFQENIKTNQRLFYGVIHASSHTDSHSPNSRCNGKAVSGRIFIGKSALLSNTTLYSLNIVNINLSLDKDSIKRKSLRVVPSVKMHSVSQAAT